MFRKNGFTVVELMIICAIIGIATAIAFPSLITVIRSNRVKSETRMVIDQLKIARITAMKDNSPTSVNITAKGISTTQTVSGKAVTIKNTQVDASAVLLSSNYPTITFSSVGILSSDFTTNGLPTVTITDGNNEYYVEVKPSGLASVQPLKVLP